jgi:hypothetical protein
MGEIKLAKWRFYLLVFITLWSFGIATDFMLARHAAGSDMWATVFHNSAFAIVVTAILYFMRTAEK